MGVCALRRSPSCLRRALVFAVLLTCGLRLAAWSADPACHRLSCLDHPSSLLLGAGEPMLTELSKGFNMVSIEERSCACVSRTGCHVSNFEWARKFAYMYTPTHVRAVPFFVGALLACSYVNAISEDVWARATAVSKSARRPIS